MAFILRDPRIASLSTMAGSSVMEILAERTTHMSHRLMLTAWGLITIIIIIIIILIISYSEVRSTHGRPMKD